MGRTYYKRKKDGSLEKKNKATFLLNQHYNKIITAIAILEAGIIWHILR